MISEPASVDARHELAVRVIQHLLSHDIRLIHGASGRNLSYPGKYRLIPESIVTPDGVIEDVAVGAMTVALSSSGGMERS